MNTLRCTLVIVLTASPVFAQSTSFTIPPGLETEQGNSNTPMFGLYSGSHTAARTQILEADLQGVSARALRGLRCRPDARNYTSIDGRGRAWKRVVMRLGNGHLDATRLQRTFSINVSGQQTTVFNRALRWPSLSGTVATTWGGPKGQLGFRFSRPYIHFGRRPLLCEWDFTGGTLDNNTVWPGSTARLYVLDSVVYQSMTRSRSGALLPNPTQRCADSAMLPGTVAFPYAVVNVHGPRSFDVNLRGRVQLQIATFYTTPKRKRIIHALSLGRSKTPIDVGARCNKLYLDLTQPTLYISHTTLGRQDNGYSGSFSLNGPNYQDFFRNLSFWMQSAWNDSKTKEFSLTAATHTRFPPRPLASQPQRSIVWSDNSTAGNVSLQGNLVPAHIWDRN